MSAGTTWTQKANPFNSTDFTSCCGLAVVWPAYGYQHGDVKCPGCKATVMKPSPPPYSPNCRMCGEPRSKCNC